MKAMLSLKQRLEKRIEKLENELKELTATLEVVNSVLLEKGFKRGSLQEAEAKLKEPIEARPVEAQEELYAKEEKLAGYHGGEPENVIPLKTANDETLAIIYIEKDSIHVLPDETKSFNINTPPFGNFLLDRVLQKMQNKDKELIRAGRLPPEKMFNYNVVREDDLIREIVIHNVDEERFRELRSSIRWTLEKMYEKMKGSQ